MRAEHASEHMLLLMRHGSEDWPSACESVPLLKETAAPSPSKKSESTDAFIRYIKRRLAIKEKP